jgi:hypothetical protein
MNGERRKGDEPPCVDERHSQVGLFFGRYRPMTKKTMGRAGVEAEANQAEKLTKFVFGIPWDDS